MKISSSFLLERKTFVVSKLFCYSHVTLWPDNSFWVSWLLKGRMYVSVLLTSTAQGPWKALGLQSKGYLGAFEHWLVNAVG